MTMTDTIKEMFNADEKNHEGLHGLFVETLRDIYHGEKQIARALPKMARKAESDRLRQAFEKHTAETEGQIARLEQAFELLDLTPRGKTCEAIQGLIAEGEELMGEHDGPVRDAAMAALAQAVEHYEIARYGALCAWAEEMGHSKVQKLLEATLNEERRTDEALNKLAEGGLNANAAAAYGQLGMGSAAAGGRSASSRHH